MILNNISENNLSITVSLNDLKTIVREIIDQTRHELEEAVIAQKTEKLVSTKTAAEMLDVDQTTLWRWANKKYLLPVRVGGKKRYRISDINRIISK